MEKKLYRNEFDKTIAGVCSGLAEYLKMDVSLVRLAFLLLAIFKGGGVLVYIILWIVLPVKHSPVIDVDYVVGDAGQAQPAYVPPVRKDNGATIGGLILVALGAFFLLDEYDFMPDWFNLGQLWPLVIIGVGIAVIFGTKKNRQNPWQQQTWDKRQPENPTANPTQEQDKPTQTPTE